MGWVINVLTAFSFYSMRFQYRPVKQKPRYYYSLNPSGELFLFCSNLLLLILGFSPWLPHQNRR